MSRNLIAIWGVLSLFVATERGFSQTCVQYRLMPQTVYELQQTPVWKDVAETSYRNERVTTYKPVWTTERRENRVTVLKPVEETSIREERHTVLKPVKRTSYRDETVTETTYETVTEMQDQETWEDVPVQETSYRDQQVIVRKPVVETRMQSENVTVYRPVTTNETQYVQSFSPVTSYGVVAQAPGPTTLEWQRRGYAFDPLTGQFVWQRPGFHWVARPGAAVAVPQTSLIPTLTPQVVQRTSLVPETIVQQKPVTVTSYVDEVTTQRVPVETWTTQRRVTTRKVPVQVQRPVTRQVTRRVPVEETEYVSQEVVEKIPVVTRRFERVEQVEPYDVQVCRWEAVESEQRTPVVTTRRVQTTQSQWVPRTVMVYVPVDLFGNPIGGYPAPRFIQPTSTPVIQQLPTSSSTAPATVFEAPVTDSSPRSVTASRPDFIISEPAVEFPVTRSRVDSPLVPIEKKEPAGGQNGDVEGKLQPADSENENNDAADQRPSLDDPLQNGAGEESDASPDNLDGPNRPASDDPAEKPRRPSGT